MSNPRNTPTYEKSVGLQVTEQPNPEGAANMMINSFRNFSEATSAFAQGITKEVAQQERETLKNNISNTYRQFSLDALRNPDQNAGLAEYTEKSRQYAAGLMQQSNKFNKPYVSNLVDYYHNEHQYSIEKNAITQNQRALSVQAYININDATRDWQDAINNSKPMIDEKGEDHQFDTSRALLADQLRSMETYAKNKFVDPAMLGKGRTEIIKKYQTAEYLKRYQDAVEQGSGNQFIAKMREPAYHIPGMNEEEKYNVINQMIKIRDQGKRGAHVAIGQLTYQMSDNLLNIENGAMPNAELQADLDALDPIRGAAYAEQVAIAQSKYSAKEANKYKSPEEKAKYKADLLNIDYSKPESAKQRRIADASIHAIDAQDKEIQSNPLEFVMRNPAIQDAVNNYEQAFNANAVGEPHKYTPFNSSVPKPWNSIIQEELHLGMTLNGKNENSVRLIDPSRVNSMINEVMQAPPLDKVIWMNKLNDEFGGGLPFKLVVNQFVAAGLPRPYALLATLDPNSPDAARIAEVVSIPAADVAKDLEAKQKKSVKYIQNKSVNDVFSQQAGGTNNFKAFLSTIPSYADQFNPEFKQDMAADITQIANYYALTQNMTADEAVQKAQNIIANRYNYTSLDNKMLRLPKSASPQAVKSYATRMRSEMHKFNFDMRGDDMVRAQYAIAHGHWVNDSIDDGLVWVDSTGKMWTDANGHPYAFSFRDAEIGVKHIAIPATQKMEQPQVTDDLDAGLYDNDEQLANIERIGRIQEKAGKKAGAKYRNLIKGNP